MEIKEIKIKELEVDDYNTRKGKWIHDQELIDSIKSMGVLQNLLVRPIEKGKFGIVCGSRRFNAGISAGLKTLPCRVKEMDDLEALGVSLQENLRRGSLDAVEESEAIADMWELINNNSTETQKLSKMKDMFGLSKSSIYRYLQISRLSDTIKSFLKPSPGTGTDGKTEPAKLDIDTASAIEGSEWEEEEKEEVAEILSDIPSYKDRKKVLSEMKKYDDELSPAEAFEKVKHVAKITSYGYRPGYLWINKAMDKAGKKWQLDYNGTIEKCLTSTSHVKKFKK